MAEDVHRYPDGGAPAGIGADVIGELAQEGDGGGTKVNEWASDPVTPS